MVGWGHIAADKESGILLWVIPSISLIDNVNQILEALLPDRKFVHKYLFLDFGCVANPGFTCVLLPLFPPMFQVLREGVTPHRFALPVYAQLGVKMQNEKRRTFAPNLGFNWVRTDTLICLPF